MKIDLSELNCARFERRPHHTLLLIRMDCEARIHISKAITPHVSFLSMHTFHLKSKQIDVNRMKDCSCVCVCLPVRARCVFVHFVPR